MTMSEISQQLNIPLPVLEIESIKAFLANKLRALESEMYLLSKKYGVKSALEFDDAIKQGLFHEQSFEDYIMFDHLESEIRKIHSVSAKLV